MTARRRFAWPTLTIVGCLAVVGLSACSTSMESVGADYRADLHEVVGVSDLDDDWTVFADPQGRLVMPGVSIAVDRVKRADSLSPDECRVLDCQLADDQEGSGIQAADGHDLLAVVFRAPERPVPVSVVGPSVLTVGTDGVSYDLASELRGLSVGEARAVILSVPDDAAAASVTTTAEEQTASLDLSTGDLADDEGSQQAAGYLDMQPAPLPVQAYEAAGRMRARTADGPLDFRLAVDWTLSGQVRRQPFHPRLGWAEPGRAWLTIGAVTPVSAWKWYDDFHVDGYDVDLAESFTLVPSDGEPVRAQPGNALIGAYYGGGNPVEPVWDVPADLTSGTITLAMTGELDIEVWRDGDDPEVRSVDWIRGQAPEPLEIDFDLAPDAG